MFRRCSQKLGRWRDEQRGKWEWRHVTQGWTDHEELNEKARLVAAIIEFLIIESGHVKFIKVV